MPWVPVRRFEVPAWTAERRIVEARIGPLQVVRKFLLQDDAAKPVPDSEVELICSEMTVAGVTDEAGEVWWLLPPGPYEVLAGGRVESHTAFLVPEKPSTSDEVVVLRVR